MNLGMRQSSDEVVDPLAILRDLEEYAERGFVQLPVEEEPEQLVTGLVFEIEGASCLVSMTEVHEVLNCPLTSVVPGSKKWVLGMANIRGSLVPVVDFHAFLNDSSIDKKSLKKRLVVIDEDGQYTGLLIDHVHKIKHFELSLLTDDVDVDCPEIIKWMVSGMAHSDGESFYICSLDRVVESDRFRDFARNVVLEQ